MIRIAVLCAIVCYPVAAWGQTSSAASVVQGSSAQGMSRSIDYGMPERLGRQVAPTPSAPWSIPDLRGYTSLLKTAEPSPIDQQKRYNLVELIDIAERVNPETRVAWEAARKAAIAVGLVESEYFPVLTLSAIGGYRSEALPAPHDVAPSGFFRATLNQAVPTLDLRWLLLDFSRRGNARDAAKERLLAANLGFNRKHQEIIFNVQRAFLGLTSLRGKIAVAQSAIDSARAVRESAEAQLRNGLATMPEVSLARQQEAQAAFDLEDVLASERDAQVALQFENALKVFEHSSITSDALDVETAAPFRARLALYRPIATAIKQLSLESLKVWSAGDRSLSANMMFFERQET